MKCENYKNVWHRDSKWINALGKNGADRLAQHSVATNLQFVKKKQQQQQSVVSVKYNKTK